jgi:DNA-directed RNA polymerase specialized sigma24 family protein
MFKDITVHSANLSCCQQAVAAIADTLDMSQEQYQQCRSFFSRLKPLINRKLTYFRCSPGIHEDLLQEGYLALWQEILDRGKVDSLDKNSRIADDAQTAANTQMQRFWRMQIRFSNSTTLLVEEPVFNDRPIEEIEILEELLKAVDSLSKKRQEIIFQRYDLSSHSRKLREISSKRTRQASSIIHKKSLQQLAQNPVVKALHKP